MSNSEKKKQLRREYSKKWRKENPEKHAEIQRKWRAKNRAKSRHIVRRSSCKRKLQPEKKKEISAYKVSKNHERNLGWDQSPRRGQRWKDYEIRVIYDSDLSISQMVEIIGRSYRSIEHARVRYIDRAPIGFSLNDKKPIDEEGTYCVPKVAEWAERQISEPVEIE
jgi:hypothetical protein